MKLVEYKKQWLQTHLNKSLETSPDTSPRNQKPRQTQAWQGFQKFAVPGTGIEPAHPCGRQILSLLRLPISPPGQTGVQY